MLDGVGMFPLDYFRLVDEAGGEESLHAEFSRRLAAAGSPETLAEDWAGYLDGLYGVCLRDVTPETMVRKEHLVRSVGDLLARPRPEDGDWRRQLREQVDELDALERPFSPDYDRSGRFPQPPTRDRLIETPRRLYPEVFAAAAVAR